MGYLQMSYVQVQWSVSCSDSWFLSEGGECQRQWFVQFIPVSGSRELEGKATKGGIGFGGDQ